MVMGVASKNSITRGSLYSGQRQTSIQVEPQVATYTPAELNGNFSHADNLVRLRNLTHAPA